ncbi:MAG TPA: HNH endonuclease [Chloroflexota bacterium]|nr:HNH endonuclease [Chloroflexota bacterium]
MRFCTEHDGHPPECLCLPREPFCEHGHELLDAKGEPTDVLMWDATGSPECAECHAHHLMAVQAILRHDSKDTSACKRGHAVTAISHGIRWSQDGKPEAYCKDCDQRIRKARSAPVEVHPRATRPRRLVLQRPIPQAAKRGLRVVMRGDGTVGGMRHETIFGNVIPLSPDVPPPRQRSYARRARALGAEPTQYDGGQIVKNSASGICHGCGERFQPHEELAVDHWIPARAFPFLSLSSQNLRLIHPACNSKLQDLVPTIEDAKRDSMQHLVPLLRAINPLNVRFRASATPLHPRDESAGPFVRYAIPGFNQDTDQEFDEHGERHPAVERWLRALEQVHGPVEAFDRQRDAVFQGTSRQFHPALKDHLAATLPEEYSEQFRLLRGYGSVWLRKAV